MRYFNENTKAEITNPDFSLGKVSSTDTNEIVSTWVIDKAATYKTVVDAENPETGAKITHQEIDTPEEGHWKHETESVYGVPTDFPDPTSSPHDFPVPAYETVSLWHVYTQAELDEIAKQKAEQEEKSKIAQEQNAALNNVVTAGGAEAAINHDHCSCILYESAPSNAITETEPFAQAYARRVERAELSIEQCPQELQERITAIEESKALCEVVAGAYEAEITRAGSSKYNRGSNIVLDVIPAQGWRVPNLDELSSKLEITAFSEDEQIEDFWNAYCNYSIVGENAQINITIPSNCVYIEIYVTCIENGKAAEQAETK